MESWESELQQEQKRVNEVTDKISKQLQYLKAETGEVKTDILGIRKHFWDDVKVNIDTEDEAIETAAAIRQQAEFLSERERTYRHSEKQIQALKRLEKSPYFARVDFKESNDPASDAIYLGTSSFHDPETDEFLVFDWRAPISSLYYDFGLGEAEYEANNVLIQGEMTLKRQYRIVNGKIKSMFDTGISIGDELLQEALGRNADSQMKTIVATIQKEQNQIIRNEKSRLLIVQGAAGSGKTSAALQRIAYLLYRYRESLTSDEMVLFSPNLMFSSYISTVLPELGEDNTRQMTFQSYLADIIGGRFQMEDPFLQLETILTGENNKDMAIRKAGIRYKSGEAFLLAVDHYVEQLMKKGLIFKGISFRGERLLTSLEISEHFYGYSHTLPIANRLKLTAEWILSELKKHEIKHREKEWVEEEIQLLDKETYLKHYQELQKSEQYTENTFDDYDMEKKLLSEFVAKKRFKPLRKRVRQLAFLNIEAVYRKLFEWDKDLERDAAFEQWREICRYTAGRLESGEMPYEDAAPFAYLEQQLTGLYVNASVKHVLIDEAQDYSLFQLAFLKNVFPAARMTVLGDVSQGIHPHASKRGVRLAEGLFPPEHTAVVELMKSYRSTKQIVEFTKEMAEGGSRIIPFNRDGKKPVLYSCTDAFQMAREIKKCLAKLRAKGLKTIAVICKTAKDCQELHELLGDDVRHRLIKKETAAFEEGIAVIPSYLSKGVEFDAVLVYDASSNTYSKGNDKSILYTVCTRAMHELHLFYHDELSPYLKEIPKEKYE
ncbi:UvrD-helicase domain-containing protein [Metabacillus sp. GX 13764]|uniref:RNA polymerase recycling motor HelD n=1 Tax=Metabacillus kandeliae TaxID=2900151 RepID=UPI001E52FEF6|nr:RNA polymerase recycling motor HelD [Metabacillus kandeliae]MCD7035920.1 UvrD-helicase domain-containing protein [Metabacillus kandeliae]